MDCLAKHICKLCKKKYASYQSLCNHNKIKHKNNNDKNLKSISNINVNACKWCNKLLSCRQAKYSHQLICKDNNIIKSDDNKFIVDNYNNELKLNNNKIINSDDNKFQFDLNKNFLTFHDKPIKYFYYNDQIYFKGGDIASMLDYIDTDQAIRKNVNKSDKIKIYQLLWGPVSETGPPQNYTFGT
jgi:hypothetical protein